MALTWLVNDLSASGMGLDAELFVSTGTCMVPLAVQPGDQVDADCGLLGILVLRASF